jgi:3-oxoacyl-[acyl-carrier-protein] synthase I
MTPVGLSWMQTCSAARAGISAIAESDFLLQGAEWERVLAASVHMRPRASDSRPAPRMQAMARLALAECISSLGVPKHRTAVVLCAPDASRVEPLEEWFGDGLQASLREGVLSGFHAASRILWRGHAGVIAGLLEAQTLLEHDGIDACVVGGVDSMLNAVDLERLEKSWRLQREGVANGLVPGEAAAFVALVRHGLASQGRSLACIRGVGVDVESELSSAASGCHPTGQGMVRALGAAVLQAGIAESAIGLRVCDQNGERYRAMDSLLTVSRFYRTDRKGLPIWHPAESFGDVGAAVGALLIQLACHGLASGHAPTQTIACESSSDEGLRAACVIQAEAL